MASVADALSQPHHHLCDERLDFPQHPRAKTFRLKVSVCEDQYYYLKVSIILHAFYSFKSNCC